MIFSYLSLLVTILCLSSSTSFQPKYIVNNHGPLRPLGLTQQPDDNEKKKVVSTVAGAVIGGALLGPVGAVLGATFGSSSSGNDKKRDTFEEALAALESEERFAQESLELVLSVLESEKKRAVNLNREAASLLEQVREALASNKEDDARALLFRKNELTAKCSEALGNAQKRESEEQKIRISIAVIQEKILELRSLRSREQSLL